MDVIKRIEELRTQRNWTKYELAEEATLTYSTLSSMYARETPPKLDVLELICNAFEISLAQFFSEGGFQAVTENEEKLLELYRALPESKRAALVTLLKN